MSELVEYRDIGDIPATRQAIWDRVLEAAQGIEPVSNSRYTLGLSDVRWQGVNNPTKAQHKKALMDGSYLTRKLSGTWTLTDNATGKPVAQRRTVIAHVPYMTDMGTFVRGGNDYTISHQLRLKPGVYTRWLDNGELEAHVNVSRGLGHKIFMEPETGIFKMRIGQASIPAYDVLSILGASDQRMRDAWGDELFERNREKVDPKALNKLYSKISYGHGEAKNDQEKQLAIQRAWLQMGLDPEVSKLTLGKPYDHVNADVILDTTSKLLKINRNEMDTDSRDDMAYQRLYGPEDIIADRLKNAPALMRQQLWKVSQRNSLDRMPSGVFDSAIDGALIGSGLGMPIEEINTLDLYDNQSRVTRLGEGGIPSIDSIPDSARNVHPSQMGLLDPIRAPESLKVGVDSRLASGVRKGKDGQLYTQVLGPDGKRHWKSSLELAQIAVAFPGALNSPYNFIPAIKNGRLLMLPKDEVDYSYPTMQSAFYPVGEMVPAMSSVKGQRAIMAARMLTQALPLVNAEAPLVQNGILEEDDKSYEELYGEKVGAIRAKEPCEVINVTPDKITVRTQNGEKKDIELYRDLVFNRKTGMTQTPVVKPGDIIKPGALLASSNFTDKDGTTAVGINARVAFLPFKGLNYEDAIVISESFAKRMASQHYYKNKISGGPDVKFGTQRFVSVKPGEYTKEQLANFSENGVIKPGTVVHPGDPLILALTRVDPSEAQKKLGRKMHWRDSSITWDHHDDGIVTDVYYDDKGAQVVVKSQQEMHTADKMSGRYGNKGVVQVVPDSELPSFQDGTKPEVLMSPLAIVGRVNPGFALETMLGKVARARGKRYALKDFEGKDMGEFVQNEASKYGVSFNEDMIDDSDPERPKTIPNVLNGYTYMMKLHHSAESKAQGRSVGSYTGDFQPSKGGDDGAKRMGMLELTALLSHGALRNVADAKYIRGQENLDYWRQYMSGFNPPTPRIPYVYHKFVNYLEGAGMHVKRDGPRVHIMALTANDVDKLTQGRELKGVKDPRTGLMTLPTVSWDNGLKPLKGGLFDPDLTGGHAGNQWSYIQLDQKYPNPVMEFPLRLMLGLTEKQFRDVMAGKDSIRTGTGPEAIYKAACNLNIENELTRAREDIRSGKTTYRDAAVRRLGYLKTAQRLKQEPKDWFMDKVPVLPPFFRPVSQMGNEKLPLVSDPNYLYKQLFDSNQTYRANRRVFGDENSGDLGLDVYDAFKAVTGLGEPTTTELRQKEVKGLLAAILGKGAKYGMVQTKLLGTPADMTGRGVVVPDPDLDMDTVGLPENIAWDTYKPFVIRELRRHGRNGMAALQEVENKTPMAREYLRRVMESRPVLLNRAPTLHKFGVMALFPKLVKGDAIHVTPFVCKGYNMDFDGDAQVGHVFVRTKANTLTRNIKSFLEDPELCGTLLVSDPLTNKEIDMKNKCALSISEGLKVRIVDLEDFPRLEKVNETEGQFGSIDWYTVPEDVEVLAYNESTGMCEWSKPTFFSVHHGAPVIIANTNCGRQIYTDDDPRAIYGINPKTFEFERMTPQAALEAGLMIPRMKYADSISARELVIELPVNEEDANSVNAYRIKKCIPVDEKLGYLLGAMIGDGWVTNNQIHLADKDFEVADGVSECIRHMTEDGAAVHSSLHDFTGHAIGESCRHTWSFSALSRFITPIIGAGCRFKHLPSWFLNTGIEFRKGLFAGLMDTDGGIGVSHSKKKPQLVCNYTTTCFRLAREIVLLAASLHISARITTTRTPKGLPCWSVSFSTPDMKAWNGVYLRSSNKLSKLRETEVQMDFPGAARTNLVPMPLGLAREVRSKLDCKRQKNLYTVVTIAISKGRVSRSIAKQIIQFVDLNNVAIEYDRYNDWKRIVLNEEITWEYLMSLENTGVIEVGYDLTVPGSDTFVNADGIVLSNTAVFHVPTTDEAVKEAVEKMLPSRNLLAPGDFKIMPTITKEHLIGLYESTRHREGGNVRTFATAQDVVAAYRRGDIGPEEKVRILDQK